MAVSRNPKPAAASSQRFNGIPAATRFTGIPAEAFEFYDSLAANNTRTWWQSHKGDWATYVRDPLQLLLHELADEFGDAHLFRPHRDTRFSTDKAPLKDHQGGYVGIEDAVGYYVQVSASGLMVAGGWYAPEGQQVTRYRAAIDAGHAAGIRSMVGSLERKHWEIDGQPLKTRPRGVDPDHPDLDLLRFRALTASRHYDVEPWMGSRRALTVIGNDWRALRPLTEWLADHVGPAVDPAQAPD
jgi:uncharacterized protein (TIGR02453 family)